MKTDVNEKYLFVVTGLVLPQFEKLASTLYVLQYEELDDCTGYFKVHTKIEL